MSSIFDTEVYNMRRNAIFTSPNIFQIMKDMTQNVQHFDDAHGAMSPNENPQSVLTVTSRPSVSSRLWWELKWVDVDGKPHYQSSQDFELLGWRAIQTHLNCRKEMLRMEKGADADSKGFIYPDSPKCVKCGSLMYKNKKDETWCSNINCPY